MRHLRDSRRDSSTGTDPFSLRHSDPYRHTDYYHGTESNS